MVNISRCKSRSVSTVPLIRATGLPLGWLDVFCGAASWVGAWEATWAEAVKIESRTTAQIDCGYFMSFSSPLRLEIEGREFLPSVKADRLEGRRDGVAAVRLVGLATVALAAELSRLVGTGGSA